MLSKKWTMCISASDGSSCRDFSTHELAVAAAKKWLGKVYDECGVDKWVSKFGVSVSVYERTEQEGLTKGKKHYRTLDDLSFVSSDELKHRSQSGTSDNHRLRLPDECFGDVDEASDCMTCGALIEPDASHCHQCISEDLEGIPSLADCFFGVGGFDEVIRVDTSCELCDERATVFSVDDRSGDRHTSQFCGDCHASIMDDAEAFGFDGWPCDECPNSTECFCEGHCVGENPFETCGGSCSGCNAKRCQCDTTMAAEELQRNGLCRIKGGNDLDA